MTTINTNDNDLGSGKDLEEEVVGGRKRQSVRVRARLPNLARGPWVSMTRAPLTLTSDPTCLDGGRSKGTGKGGKDKEKEKEKEEGEERESGVDGDGEQSDYSLPVSQTASAPEVMELDEEEFPSLPPPGKRSRGRPVTTGAYKHLLRARAAEERERLLEEHIALADPTIPPLRSPSIDRLERNMIGAMEEMKRAPARDIIAQGLTAADTVQKITQSSKNLKGNLVSQLNKSVIILRTAFSTLGLQVGEGGEIRREDRERRRELPLRSGSVRGSREKYMDWEEEGGGRGKEGGEDIPTAHTTCDSSSGAATCTPG